MCLVTVLWQASLIVDLMGRTLCNECWSVKHFSANVRTRIILESEGIYSTDGMRKDCGTVNTRRYLHNIVMMARRDDIHDRMVSLPPTI